MNFIKFRKVGNDEQCIFSVFQKDIKQINRFAGGVLNVRSDLSVQQQAINNISNANTIKQGVIKSVQRGVVTQTLKNDGSQKNTTVSINEVNPENCLVIINGRGSSYGKQSMCIIQSLSNTELIINASTFTGDGFSNNGTNEHTYSWQIIEFY